MTGTGSARAADHSMRKILNAPESVVDDYLAGLAAAHRDIIVHDLPNRLIKRSGAPVTGKVGIVAGGGSGCEPLHTGFVGPGMIDAAVAGDIFTSPVPRQIVAATRAVNGGAGVLHVVKNYPGEVMNFEMAEEILDFDDDIDIASVLVDDDVATRGGAGSAGGRGLGATLLVERIAGAAAEQGGSLTRVREVAERVNDRARSFGVGFSSCTPPLRGRPIFDLPNGEVELGIGISGEPGRERAAMLGAGRLADLMLDTILADLRPSTGARLLTLVNGLGATPDSELYLLYGEVVSRLRDRGFEPARVLVGSFLTSLDQAGAALTVLELDDDMIGLWDSPVHAPALRWKA